MQGKHRGWGSASSSPSSTHEDEPDLQHRITYIIVSDLVESNRIMRSENWLKDGEILCCFFLFLSTMEVKF